MPCIWDLDDCVLPSHEKYILNSLKLPFNYYIGWLLLPKIKCLKHLSTGTSNANPIFNTFFDNPSANWSSGLKPTVHDPALNDWTTELTCQALVPHLNARSAALLLNSWLCRHSHRDDVMCRYPGDPASTLCLQRCIGWQWQGKGSSIDIDPLGW